MLAVILEVQTTPYDSITYGNKANQYLKTVEELEDILEKAPTGKEGKVILSEEKGKKILKIVI